MMMMMIFWKVSKWPLGHHLDTSEPKTSVMTRRLSIWRILQENFKLHWMVSEVFPNEQKLEFRVNPCGFFFLGGGGNHVILIYFFLNLYAATHYFFSYKMNFPCVEIQKEGPGRLFCNINPLVKYKMIYIFVCKGKLIYWVLNVTEIKLLTVLILTCYVKHENRKIWIP